eukprot:TRINITY_DN3115_c0_g1_i3.p1 TRINITY_DN3115_c0_g1~~TRINITY_DN3115_c0_g1_i3.p1  ORF type:complete len:595 (+),score=122.06 TRINITY_DN3115_c0_g1_i3:49-1833(+)
MQSGVGMASQFATELGVEQVIGIFRQVYDTSGDGTIPREHMEKLLVRLGGEVSLIDDFLTKCSSSDEGSGSGRAINYSDFVQWAFQNKARLFQGSSAKPRACTFTDSARLEIDAAVAQDLLVVFGGKDHTPTQMVMHALRNILEDERIVVFHNISGKSNDSKQDVHGLMKQRELVEMTGQNDPPYVFLARKNMGSTFLVIQMIKTGIFKDLLKQHGIKLKENLGEVSLAKNLFNYPKGNLGGLDKWGREGSAASQDKLNVLVVSCGSSASDKIPTLVGKLKGEGFAVKLATTKSGEHFFKDHGMQELMQHLDVSDIYRDEDEWAFRYQSFGMPVRALHLALCDWADIAVVAPASCNSMGKIAHGCADTLVTCIFVAWQYQQKPAIFAPACNMNMWNNISTRNAVSLLKEMGVTFVGPAEGILSNGRKGIGMMAPLDEIMENVMLAKKKLDNPVRWMLHKAQKAAKSKLDLWPRVLRFFDEGVVGINDVDSNLDGDSVLHIALSAQLDECNSVESRKCNIDVEVVAELIKRRADVNLANQFKVTPLHLAVRQNHYECCSILLKAGANPAKMLNILEGTQDDSTEGMLKLLRSHSR